MKCEDDAPATLRHKSKRRSLAKLVSQGLQTILGAQNVAPNREVDALIAKVQTWEKRAAKWHLAVNNVPLVVTFLPNCSLHLSVIRLRAPSFSSDSIGYQPTCQFRHFGSGDAFGRCMLARL
jgi:hypothetical protein